MRKKLTGLNFVRAAACMGVFTFHCYISLLGAWAVSVFVILSGFLLVYNGLDRVDSFPRDIKGCAKYSFNKIKKLYPLYAITLVILIVRIFLLAPENPPRDELVLFAKQFLFDFLLIQSWLMSTEWAFAHNGVGWYLSTCVLLYFAFPYILRWIKAHNGIKSALKSILVIAILMVVTQFLATELYCRITGMERGASGSFQHWFSYIFPIYRLGDFAIGGLLGYIFTLTPVEKISRTGATAIEFLSIVLVVISQALFRSTLLPTGISYNLLFVPANSLLVFSFALRQGAISQVLDCRLSNLVADYSVEIFLIHFAVIKYASPFATILPIPFALQQWSFLFFALIATFVSVYLYRRLSRRIPFLSVR
ncbi:MAG: acyltransferase [Oscillospiraceae bacterium]|nr:acyltransferase [Oscillospiraceae bacterium]